MNSPNNSSWQAPVLQRLSEARDSDAKNPDVTEGQTIGIEFGPGS